MRETDRVVPHRGILSIIEEPQWFGGILIKSGTAMTDHAARFPVPPNGGKQNSASRTCICMRKIQSFESMSKPIRMPEIQVLNSHPAPFEVRDSPFSNLRPYAMVWMKESHAERDGDA